MNLKRTIKGIICLSAGMLFLLVGSVWAGTINVDVNDPACVSGSGQPDPYSIVYCNIQDAIDDATSGDVINVAAGTYAGFTVTTANIEVRGAQYNIDPAGATTRGGAGDIDESLITSTIMITANYVTVNGFKTSYPINVGYDHAWYVNISYNISLNADGHWGAIHLHGIAAGPVYNQCDFAYIGYNTISGTTSPDWQGGGIWTVGNDDVTIEHNHILNSQYMGIMALNHVGDRNQILHNTITGSGHTPIRFWGGSQVDISHNVVDGGGSDGIWVDQAADNSTVSYNQISNVTYSAVALRAGATGINVHHNTITASGTGIEKHDNDITGITVNYNDIYGNSAGFGGGCTAALDVRYNYWGGGGIGAPGEDGNNSCNATADYSPWLGATVGTSPMTWGTDDSIQDAIDVASAGDVINVAAGTYPPFTVDSKSVSVEGQSGAVVTGNQTVSTAYGDRTTIVFLKSSFGVNLTGIEVQGPPSGTPRYGVIVEDTRGTFTEGVISPNNVTEWSNGCAIGIWGNSIFHLTQDTVRSFGKAGIFYYGASASGQITDCVVEAPVLDDSLRLTNAVEADYGATVEVSNTEVFNSRNLHPDPEWASVGIMSYGYGVPTTLTVTNSHIHDNDYGVWVEDGSAAQAQINRNDIAGNVKYGVVNQETSFLNASANWWGDYWGPATGGKFSSENVSALPSIPEENVDMRFGRKAELVASGGKNFGAGGTITENVAYSPWLGYAVNTTPMTYLVDTTGAIQEGIDFASEADSVRVLPGTYVENIVIDKPLALLGAGRDSVLVYTDSSNVGPPSGPSFQGSQMVVVQADNVLVDGFTFDGDNPILTPVGTLDARNGIISNHTLGDWDNLKVRNCSVNNVYLRAIYPSAQGSVSGIEITDNTVYNAAGVSMQSAGIMLWGASGTITNNRIGVASYGIFLQNGSDGEVSFNSVDSCELGIGVNGNDQPTNLVSNKITDSNQGIQTIAINAEVNISHDTVLGCRYGMVMYGLGSGFNTVDGNLFDGQGLPQALGFYISNYTDWGAGDVRGNLTNNQIVNNWLGIVLNESAVDTTEDVLVTIGGDSSLYNLIYDNDSSELYLEYCNDDIDATYNYWGTSTFPQIEQEIFHQSDVPSLGLVNFSQAYLLGDVNLDRVIDIGDIVYLINYLYKNGPAPYIQILGDVNRDEITDIGDVIFLINYLYRSGPPPVPAPRVARPDGQKQKLSPPTPCGAPLK